MFKTRSSERDVITDTARVAQIVSAIRKALAEAETEKVGLSRRLADVVARASLTVGNQSDEYLTRDSLSSQHQNAFSADIKYAEGRLQDLETNISNYISLKQAADKALHKD